MADKIEALCVCSCRTPLISTFAFRGAEFYCVNCGNTYGMFDATSVPATPERLAEYEALKAEWDEHVGGKLLVARSRKRDCDQCWGDGSTDHPTHATDEERRQDELARQWLDEKKGATV